MMILAIETSCDETASAVISFEKCDMSIKKNNANYSSLNTHILSNVVASQIALHRKYGGVFPEIASRAHTEQILSVIQEALSKSQKFDMSNEKLASKNAHIKSLISHIDLIAVTSGPGLIGSLLVGVNTAKTLAYANKKPIIGINHWLGHIYSNFSDTIPQFPALILIVSGGHTGLVLMKSHTDIQTIGETLDDAAGEAFDKVAKILGLGYPGGPAIALTAQRGEPLKYAFPRAMLNRDDFNFSFSGLKTAVLYESKKHRLDDQTKADFAASFQQCVIDILIGKTLQAAEKFHPKSICLCGGVSANKELREQMAEAIKKFDMSNEKLASPKNAHITYHIPPIELTTDNAAMIGLAAAYQIANGIPTTDYSNINADANLKL